MTNYTEVERRNDFHWFLENYDSFYKQYGYKFFAIQNKVVLGVYNGIREALDETSKQYPLGTFIIQLCNGDESGYTNYIASNEVGVI